MNQKRDILRDQRGSATIEAAVLIPFFMIILLAVLWLGFFLYNKCALERACHMAALRGSQQIWEDQEFRYRVAESGIGEILSYNLLGTEHVQQEIVAADESVTVSVYMEQKWWEFYAQSEKKVLNPVKFVRKIRRIKGVVN